MKSNWQIISLWVLLLVALTSVYSNHFDNTFHFDDAHTISNNHYITDIRNIPKFFVDARTTSSLPSNQAYRPIVTTLNALDYWIGDGLVPEVFHWHIFLEFLILLIVLYLVLNTVFKTATGQRHPYVAVFATFFFAFHTATAETLNYIIARSDGFSTLMVLTGMLIFVRNTGWKKQLGLIPFLIGCLTKPTALMLAPLLAFYSLYLERPSLGVASERSRVILPIARSFKETVLYFIFGVLMYFFTRSMFSPTWAPGGDYSGLEYLTTQPWVLWIYVKTFLIPTGLTADTDLEVIRDFLDPRILWGLLVIAVMASAAVWASTRRKTLPIAFGIAWFFIALIPSSSVIPLAEVMNHHRTFFPYIGLVMASAWVVYLLIENVADKFPGFNWKPLLAFLLSALFAAHAWGTWLRNEVWDSSSSLWRDVALKSPNNGRGLMNYGLSFMQANDLETALEYFERATATSYGNHPYLHLNMGVAKAALARRQNSESLNQKAGQHFRTAVLLGSGFPKTHYFYAKWLHQNGDYSAALARINRALELSPASKDSQNLLTSIQKKLEQIKAEDGIEPRAAGTTQSWLAISFEHYKAGEYEKSLGAAYQALAIDMDYAPAYNNICAASIQLGKYTQAIAACRQALSLQPDFDRAKANLAWAEQKREEMSR